MAALCNEEKCKSGVIHWSRMHIEIFEKDEWTIQNSMVKNLVHENANVPQDNE